MDVIVTQQYQLAKLAGISIEESLQMADFEREAYLNLLIRDIKRDAESIASS